MESALGKFGSEKNSLTPSHHCKNNYSVILESSGSWGYMVVKIKKRSDEDFDKIIGALRLGADAGKILVVVDEDIDARDPDSVNWALSFNMQPHRDVRILDGGMMGLDPSIVPSEDFGGARSALFKTGRCSVLCIDATRPWAIAGWI